MKYDICFINTACYFLLIVISMAEEAVPGDSENQHEFLIVSLKGKTAKQFTDIQLGFKNLIANLATDFCSENGLKNYGTVNSTTVEIHDITPCPTEWPDSELCINVNFSVPINLLDPYELSSRHLRSMWKNHNTSQLKELGVQEYEIPSSSTILILWLCVTGLLFLLFLIILIVVIKTKFIEKYLRRRRDIIGSSNRSWLAQHGEKQLVPPFFYPEPPITKLKESPVQSDSERNIRRYGNGIENPGYDHDMVINRGFEKQISQTTTIVDDFDSDDETIYPPYPLQRSSLRRNERGSRRTMPPEETETAF